MITLFFMMLAAPRPAPPAEYWAHQGHCWYRCRKVEGNAQGVSICDLGCAAKPKEMP